jgi:hypothetical protein
MTTEVIRPSARTIRTAARNGDAPKTPTAGATRRTYGRRNMDRRCTTRVPHVGVVFTHGIGSQVSGETLREWSAPLIGLLRDWRIQRGLTGDPILESRLNSDEGTGLFIEVELPATRGRGAVRAQHWVMTEAWWASRVVAPSFAEMISWLGSEGTLARIVKAFLRRGRKVATTVGEDKDAAEPPPEAATRSGAEAFGSAVSDRMQPVGRQIARMKGLPEAGTITFLSSMAALLLVLYEVLRVIGNAIPIAAIRTAVIGRVDSFMLDWFGDVHVLLGDFAQSAGVRARLAESIRLLIDQGCDQIIVVAHSGGAIVAYLTLCDAEFNDLQIDRVVTLGEGLNLAWRVSGASEIIRRDCAQERHRYGRLVGSPGKSRRDLQWTDFWATNDPAPLGALDVPACVVAPRPKAQAVPIWNRLSTSDDHGSYWANDEEFVIPLAQLIERTGEPDHAVRLYPEEVVEPSLNTPDGPGATDRRQKRRERVWMLGFWRRAMTALPILAVASVALLIFLGRAPSFLHDLGQGISNLILKIPGADLFDGLLVNLREMDRPTIITGWAALGVTELSLIIMAGLLLAALNHGRADVWIANRRGLVHVVTDWVLTIVAAILVGVYIAISIYSLLRLFFSPGDLTLLTLLNVANVLLVVTTVVIRFLRGRYSRRPAIMLLSTITMVAGAGILLMAPILALILLPSIGYIALAFAAIFGAFEVIKRIGVWRWMAWDARERRGARRIQFSAPNRGDVLAQGILLSATALTLFASVVAAGVFGPVVVPGLFGPTELAPALTGLSIVLGTVAVIVGVSIDSVDAARSDRRPGGSVGRYSETVEKLAVSESAT